MMLNKLPTTLWLVGATVTVAAFSPVVGQVATSAPPPAVTAPAAGADAPAATESAAPTADPSTAASEPPATPGAATQPDESSPPGSATPAPEETAGQAGDQTVVKAGTTKLGPTAVDAEGFTMYLSVIDGTDPSKSVCVSTACVAAWTPVTVDGEKPIAGAGVDQAKLGVTLRADRTKQATLGGWPLYRFAEDQKPGDVLGEGLKGTWRAIGPDGKAVAKNS